MSKLRLTEDRGEEVEGRKDGWEAGRLNTRKREGNKNEEMGRDADVVNVPR